jgi:hypothetical protein
LLWGGVLELKFTGTYGINNSELNGFQNVQYSTNILSGIMPTIP